jgi:uncharacterized protein (DUF2126 family)
MSALEDEVAEHDAALAQLELPLWIGAEPTFTRRESQEPIWLYEAEGGDKEAYARALLTALASRHEAAMSLRCCVGRQFPEEPKPRFALGALWDRQAKGGPAFDVSGLDAPPVPPPPIEPCSAWLTVTPDPGVVEVNMAPAPDLATFLRFGRAVYRAAEEAGLSAVRYRWSGEAVDSGGGGQVTLGGPTPEESPFFRPGLLARVLRYFQRHPALSYAFATECVGSASQGPRPDEGVRERFEELELALDRVESRGADLRREELWASLAPLLVDSSGNSHRAEINIEKLWNPRFAGRGLWGLVEFRALRMEPVAERMVAVGALLRATVARLAAAPYREPLIDWGCALHDRFALPHFLRADLALVLEDLARHGLGLGTEIAGMLLEPRVPIVRVEDGGATLTVTPALEFWPLVGDVASQERSGARVVDSSTSRVELCITAPSGESPGRVGACGWEIPLVPAGDSTFIGAVRYRTFSPQPGLHPGLRPIDPLELVWDRGARAFSIALHGWIPGGGAYDGLPGDAAEAERRRRERVVVRAAPSTALRPLERRPSGISVDLRGLAA